MREGRKSAIGKALTSELKKAGLKSDGTLIEQLDRFRHHISSDRNSIFLEKQPTDDISTDCETYHCEHECSFGESVIKTMFHVDQEDLEQHMEINSSSFQFAGSKWTPHVTRDKEDGKIVLSFWLFCDRDNTSAQFLVKFIPTVSQNVNGNDKVIVHQSNVHKTDWNGSWGFNLIKTQSLDHFKNFVHFKFYIKLTVFGDVQHNFLVRPTPRIVNMGERLLKLHRKEDLSDFIIKLQDGSDLNVHKLLLCLHSPVFSRMINNNAMVESLEDSVEISDFEPQVVKSFVEFLYSGEVSEDLDAEKLLLIADKYQVDCLIKHCLQLLVQTITKENCCHLLMHIKRFNYFDDFHMQRSISRYIHDNLELVEETPGWKELCKDSSLLLLVLKSRSRKRNFEEMKSL